MVFESPPPSAIKLLANAEWSTGHFLIHQRQRNMIIWILCICIHEQRGWEFANIMSVLLGRPLAHVNGRNQRMAE